MESTLSDPNFTASLSSWRPSRHFLYSCASLDLQYSALRSLSQGLGSSTSTLASLCQIFLGQLIILVDVVPLRSPLETFSFLLPRVLHSSLITEPQGSCLGLVGLGSTGHLDGDILHLFSG